MQIFLKFTTTIISLLIFVVGGYTVVKSTVRHLKIYFGLLAVFIFLWIYSSLKMLNGSSWTDYQMWYSIFIIISIGISSIYFNFIYFLTNSNLLKKINFIGYFFSFVMLSTYILYNFTLRYEYLAIYLTVINFIFISFGLFSLYDSFKNKLFIERKSRFIFLSHIFWFLGILGVLSFNILPAPLLLIGWLLILLSFLILANLIARFPTIEINTLFLQSVKWFIIGLCIFGPIILILFFLNEWIVIQKNLIIAVVALTFFYAVLMELTFVQVVIDKLFGRRVFKKNITVRGFFYKVSSLLTLDELIFHTGIFFKDLFGFVELNFYLFDSVKNKFILYSKKPIISNLKTINNIKIPIEIFITPDIDFWDYWIGDYRFLTHRDASTFDNVKASRSFLKILNTLNADALFPLVFSGSYLGFFALNADSLKQSLRLENIKILDEMRDELAITFSNTSLFNKTSIWNASLEEKIKDSTRELQEINDKLSDERYAAKKLNRIIIDRELEMIKLKKTI